MNKYNEHWTLNKSEINTKFGIVTINELGIDPILLEELTTEIILDKENLKFIFCEKNLEDFELNNMYDKFLPNDYERITDIDKHVEKQVNTKRTFYTFLAEALLGIILRDIYDYQLTRALLDVSDTLIDGHTGVDACLFDENQKIIILGEAKFYKNVKVGIEKIALDLTNQKGFYNKIDSMKRNAQSNKKSRSIILNNLSKDTKSEISMEEFLSLNHIFAGFVLHQHSGPHDKYKKLDFYDDFDLSSKQIKENLEKAFNMVPKGNYKIIILHLPVNSKKDLIVKTMEKAYQKKMLLKEVD